MYSVPLVELLLIDVDAGPDLRQHAPPWWRIPSHPAV